ncbi:CIA30 family protein [Spirulina major]|uniref:CIA30 family protein n=1 Tax=Spirulina major TaxID=270636 RepID=UPI00093280F5|nr:CIA30 family protein [Spirulina major]
MILFDFQTLSLTELHHQWRSIDDGVMGGVSASRIEKQADGALFTGYTSTDRSGGFVSVRSRDFDPPRDLSAYSGIRLRIKGDGQRYKFFLRDQSSWDGIAYATSFDTAAGQWLTVELPFDQFKAVFRAKTLSDAPPLTTRHIIACQLMLSKFEYDQALNPHFFPGNFSLWVQRIEAD